MTRPDVITGPGQLPRAHLRWIIFRSVLRQDQLQMPLAEDQHPVGDLGPGGEHEPFRISVRSWASGRDLHGLDTGVGQDCVK